MCALLVAAIDGCDLASESDETSADGLSSVDAGLQTGLSDPPGDPGSGCGSHGPGC